MKTKFTLKRFQADAWSDVEHQKYAVKLFSFIVIALTD